MGTPVHRSSLGSAPSRSARSFGVLQRLGRSLMLPIAALPVAALLLRLGQPDMLGAGDSGLALGARWSWLEPVADVLAAAGGSLFSHIGLLFAVGVAIGFARKGDGSTALAAVVGYVVFDAVTTAMAPYVLHDDLADAGAARTAESIDYGVLGGILVGLLAAVLWQRYHRIALPPYLAFFGGRRFVPIVTALAALLLAVAMSFVFPLFDAGLDRLGRWLVENDVLGAGVYGFVNRLLIPYLNDAARVLEDGVATRHLAGLAPFQGGRSCGATAHCRTICGTLQAWRAAPQKAQSQSWAWPSIAPRLATSPCASGSRT